MRSIPAAALLRARSLNMFALWRSLTRALVAQTPAPRVRAARPQRFLQGGPGRVFGVSARATHALTGQRPGVYEFRSAVQFIVQVPAFRG